MSSIEIPYLGTDVSRKSLIPPQASVAAASLGGVRTSFSSNPSQKNWHAVLPTGDSSSIVVTPDKSTLDRLSSHSPVKTLPDLPITEKTTNQKIDSDANPVSKIHSGLAPGLVSPLPKTQEAIDRLAASILEKFPLGDPTVISFVCSERNPHLELTSVAVCRTLASMHIGNVLLVDSTANRKLTALFGLEDDPGLSNMLVDTADWEQMIECISESDFEFLPAGTSHWEHWGGERQLRILVSHLKKRYQFILVASGEAQSSMAKLWSGLTDGDYLLVSVSNSHPAVAESAISELQSCGARLMGCVVTDHTLI